MENQIETVDIEAAKTKPFGYPPFYPGTGLGTLAKLKESAGMGEVIVPHNDITEKERKAVERACR